MGGGCGRAHQSGNPHQPTGPKRAIYEGVGSVHIPLPCLHQPRQPFLCPLPSVLGGGGGGGTLGAPASCGHSFLWWHRRSLVLGCPPRTLCVQGRSGTVRAWTAPTHGRLPLFRPRPIPYTPSARVQAPPVLSTRVISDDVGGGHAMERNGTQPQGTLFSQDISALRRAVSVGTGDQYESPYPRVPSTQPLPPSIVYSPFWSPTALYPSRGGAVQQ